MKPLLIFAILLLATSGLPGLFVKERSDIGQTIAQVMHTVGSIILAILAFVVLISGKALVGTIGVIGNNFATSVVLDPLAAVFLLPMVVITNLSSLYGLRYWRQSDGAPRASFLRVMYGTVTAGLCSIVLAGDVISFLIAWEVMAISTFFLVTTDEDKAGVKEAGWVFFVTTHVSTLILFGLFGLTWVVSGSNIFAELSQTHLSQSVANTLFIMAVAGFGIKAGIFPGHYWLPPAHSSAPSHVSAFMSGVLIKIGIYGLVRILFLLQSSIQFWWGLVILGLGVVSAVLGVSFALGQHDLKKLLACHSIENIGIICIGLGVMLLGYSQGSILMIVLGLTGALLHVWNHALFKGLLFLSAGSVIHATGTRDIDLLGGLAKSMPRSAFFFVFGATAICGLPPLNGFVSEFLIYNGLIRGLSGQSGYAMVAGCLGLALVGGLAVGCFVKAFGSVFLGSGRSHFARAGHESPVLMQLGMAGLAVGCLMIALAPVLATSLLMNAVSQWLPPGVVGADLFYENSGIVALSIINPIIALLIFAGCVFGVRSVKSPVRVTWDCGYAKPATTMQYTASSFAQMFVDILSKIIIPITRNPVIEGVFPEKSSFHTVVPDIVLDRTITPAIRLINRLFARAHLMQRGNLQAYVMYVLLAFVLLMIFAVMG